MHHLYIAAAYQILKDKNQNALSSIPFFLLCSLYSVLSLFFSQTFKHCDNIALRSLQVISALWTSIELSKLYFIFLTYVSFYIFKSLTDSQIIASPGYYLNFAQFKISWLELSWVAYKYVIPLFNIIHWIIIWSQNFLKTLRHSKMLCLVFIFFLHSFKVILVN